MPLIKAATTASATTVSVNKTIRSGSAPPALYGGAVKLSSLERQQQQQQPENGKLMINNDQLSDKFADGETKDSAVVISGKQQQQQQHSNATNQTSVPHKPLHPTAPAPVPIATHVVSEHLTPHPQGQHPGPPTETAVNNKPSFIPNSVNAMNQPAPSPHHTPPPTPSHTSVAKQHHHQQQQQHPNASSIPPPLFSSEIKSPRDQYDIVERSPRDRYVRFAEKLGSGAYKTVYRAYDTIEGIEVAWNVVKLTGVPKTERGRIVNEVQLLQRLSHKNIISFHGSWVNREKEQVVFVTEILSSGTLKSFVDKVQVIRWRIAKRWATQILNGLDYMHSLDPPIIHRDLKCDNIFINGTSGDLRIGDLGLSTVISTNKTLSVLGTPEFMAPELYDEVYDEKIDVYAFGMCLLEIFTKEIPYRECSNPAQIYKKVTNGIMPESLSRVRSQEAREFIMLCLGDKDCRPSTSELLLHPFLAEKSDDDAEVEVDSPIQATAINEISDGDLSSGGSSADKSRDAMGIGGATRPANEVQKQGQNIPRPTLGVDNSALSSTPPPPQQSQTSAHASGHAESDHFSRMMSIETNTGNPQPVSRTSTNDDRMRSRESSTEDLLQGDGGSQGAQTGKNNGGGVVGGNVTRESEPQYLVAAAVIETEEGERPYPDDILKLNFTLPVEGQTQTVQFDFHLVEDDPIEVAKEMVSELEIPQGAVLEISETISGLARNARMKVGRFNQEQIQKQHMLMQQQQQQQLLAQHQAMLQQAQQTGMMMQPPLVGNSENYVPGGVAVPNAMHHNLGGPVIQPHIAGGANLPVPLPQASAAIQHQQQHPVPTATISGMQGGNAASHTIRPPILPPVPESNVASGSHMLAPSSSQEQLQMKEPVVGNATPNEGYLVSGPAPISGQTLQHNNLAGASHVQQTNIPHQSAQVDNDIGSETSDDESMQGVNSEELRKLEEDYQKNIMRAKKAYVTRMDNLQRSKEEKEAQHLKTLEKHEKEKADFEKRVKLAEAEQNRRLEQIEQEHARQRAATLEKAKLEREGVISRDSHTKVKRKIHAVASNVNLDASVSQLANSLGGSLPSSQDGMSRNGTASSLPSSDESSRVSST